MTMTLAGILADMQTVFTEFGAYIAIGVAIPLGIKFGGVVKNWVTKR